MTPSAAEAKNYMQHSSRLEYLLRHPAKGIYKEWLILTAGLEKVESQSNLALPPAIREIFSRLDESTPPAGLTMYEIGGKFQRERIAALAEYCAERFEGDFVEIGAYQGQTSRMLAEVAKRHGRKLLVIDPWITGSQDCKSDEFEQFQQNIASNKDVVDVWRESSVDPAVIARLAKRPLCFAFVDGWHVLDACLSDILAAGHTKGIIAIDDTRYNHDLLFAVRRGAKKLGHTAILQDTYQRESYIFSAASLR